MESLKFKITPRLLFWCLALTGLGIRFALAFSDYGIYWPDENYQSLEPAHKLAFGVGRLPWEYEYGLRHSLLPSLLATIMKLCAILGIESPFAYINVIRFLFCSLSLVVAYSIFDYLRSLDVPHHINMLAVSSYLFCAPNIYFAHRALSEIPATCAICLGLALCLKTTTSQRKLLVAGFILGVATMFRLQSIFFLATMAVLLLAQKRSKNMWCFMQGVLAAMLIFALMDWWSWGTPFYSALQYLRFNLFQNAAQMYGAENVAFYFETLYRSSGPLIVLLGILSLFAARKAFALFLITWVFLAVFSFLPHKELRFILPLWPLLSMLAGVGLANIQPKQLRLTCVCLLLFGTLFSLATHRNLHFSDLGQRNFAQHQESAYGFMDATIQLLMQASTQDDLCGLLYDQVPITYSGGYAYMHQAVPTYLHKKTTPYSEQYNYAITKHISTNATLVKSVGNVHLIKLVNPMCTNQDPIAQRLHSVQRNLPLPQKNIFLDGSQQ